MPMRTATKSMDIISKKNKLLARAAHFFVHFIAVVFYKCNAVLHD